MSQPTPVEKKVMVLGGAPEARATVQELLGLGYQVAWLASEAVPPAPDEVPELSVYDEAEFVRFEGQVGGFCLSGQRQGAAFTVSAAAEFGGQANVSRRTASAGRMKLVYPVPRASQPPRPTPLHRWRCRRCRGLRALQRSIAAQQRVNSKAPAITFT